MSVFKLPAITTAQRAGLVLGARELVFDTTINQVFRGDGATLGGLSLAGISDGDKGDVVVSGGGVVWTLDAAIQATLRDRATHTGAQLSTTVSDFAEAVDDRVAALLVAGTNITLAYNDVANTLTITASGGGITDGDKGDITVATGGTVWTVDAGAITLAKMADVATSTLLGRVTAATGVVEALTPAQGRTVLGLATIATSASAADLTAGLLPAARFDDTAHGARAGGTTHANAVAAGAAGFMTGADKTKLDGVATGANLYVHPNHSGDVTSVADGATTIVAGAVTLAKQANMATASVVYRKTAAAGAPEVQTLATLKTDLGLTGTNSGDQTITLTGDTTGTGIGSFATTLATVNANVGSFGLAGSVAQFTVNAKGLITAAANVVISIASTAISDSTAAGRAMLTAATAAAQTALLSVFGASGAGSAKGLVPDPGATMGITRFLREDGTWITPAGVGDMVLATAQTNVGLKTFVDGSFGLRNVLNTFTALFTNSITAARTYTLKDASGTIAFTSDITGVNSGTNTGDQTITLTGNVTGTGTGSFATTIAADAVTNAILANVNSATFKGRVTAAAGDPEDLTGTQATTLLDAFTSALKGVVPASGGGTVNFLRADGTFAAPGGGGAPGGTTGQVQFNNAGAFGGAAQVNIATGFLNLINTTIPAAPAADQLTLYRHSIAKLPLVGAVGPANVPMPLQRLLIRSGVGVWTPGGGGTVAPGLMGFGVFNVTGSTATARNSTTTNYFTRRRRQGYVTAATAGAVGQFRAGNNAYTIGSGAGVGGFFMALKFGCSDAAAVTGARMWFGMGNSTVAPTNVEPSTLLNCIGIGHGAAGTNMKLFYGGSAAQTPIDLGVNFPVNTLSVDMYELALFAPPNTQTVHYEVTRLNTGNVATGTLSGVVGTAVPAATTLMNIVGYRTNNATALACGFDIVGAYIEMSDE